MQLQGQVIDVFPIQSGTGTSGNTWARQDFLLEYRGSSERRKRVVLTISGEERIRRFDIHKDGHVEVYFDLDAREWQGRWFTTTFVFDVRPLATSPVPASAPAPTPNVVYAKDIPQEGVLLY